MLKTLQTVLTLAMFIPGTKVFHFFKIFFTQQSLTILKIKTNFTAFILLQPMMTM